MEARQPIEDRVRDAARQVLREVIDGLPAPTKYENESVWLEGLERWLTEFDRDTRSKPYSAHALVKLARQRAAEYYDDCFRQPYHQDEDVVAWRFELSRGLLIVKGYFRDEEGGDVEQFHGGYYLALTQGVNAAMWQQNTLVPPRQPRQASPVQPATINDYRPLMRWKPVITACLIGVVVIVTFYLFG